MSEQPDERRDRYAAAMAKRDGHEWPPEFEDDEHDYRRRADAAIAVADGEITRALDAEASNAARYLSERDAERDENARLRAAAPSAPADRAAALREAADEAEAENARCNAVGPCQQCSARTTIAIRLRRMADEAQQAGEAR